MAIKVGQVRKLAGTNYITDLPHTFSTFNVVGVGNTIFSEFAIIGNFNINTTYYVRLLINRIDINEHMGDTTAAGDNDPHNLNIDIRLYAENDESSHYQTIGEPLLIQPYFNDNTVTILESETSFINWCDACIADGNPAIPAPAQEYYTVLKNLYQNRVDSNTGRQSNITVPYQSVELVFTPYENATCLVFQLRRVTYDYTVQPRVLTIVEQDVSSSTQRDVAVVNNILPKSLVNKIGIQTRPGSLVVINQEQMRVGKSGVLEINNGIPITSVSMVAPNNNIDDFILDYTYNA